VAGVANKQIYVCGFAISIAGSASSAATAQFETGTGAACVTTQVVLTGTFGSNDAAVSTVPTVINYGGANQTVMSASAAGNPICIVTAGTSVFVQGVLTYVQQ